MWLRKWIAATLSLACAACASAARLEWDANQDGGLTVGYKIHYGLASRQYTNTVDVGNVTEWPIPAEWPRNQDYFFAATAYSATGQESGYSNEAIYYADEIPPPAPPTDVRITFQEIELEPPMAINPSLAVAVAATFDYRTNTTLSKPTGTVDGDFLLAAITVGAPDQTVTAPAGWTQIGSTVTITGRNNLQIYYKRASSEGTDWTWTHSYSVSGGAVWRLTGVVASGDPQDATLNSTTVEYGPTGITNSSITTGTDGALVVQIACVYYQAEDITSHTMTLRANCDDHITMSGDLQTTAGATGTKTVGFAGYQYAISFLIAIKPAAAASGSIVPILLHQYRARRD